MFLSKDQSKPLASRFKIYTAMAVISAICLAPLIITGLINLSQFRQAYQAKVTDHMEAMVRQHREKIDTFLTNRQSDIRVLTRVHPFEKLTDSDFLSAQLNLLREEYHGAFVDLGVVDSGGLQIAYAGPFNLLRAEYSTADWFRAARGQAQFVSDVFAGLRGSPHFIVVSSFEHEGESYLAKATIDFEAFTSLVKSIRIGRTGFAFIFNRQGDFQTNPRFDVDMGRAPYVDAVEGRLRADPVVTVEGENALEQPSFFSVTTLKQGDWYLCYQQTRSDALSSLRQVQTVAATVFLMAALITVAVTYLVSRSLALRLAETDQRRRIMNDKVIETGRLASIGELAAGIAHEINNPVAIMVQEAGWIDDLLGSDVMDAEETMTEIERAVRQIQTQGERCKDITYKLLSFARKTDPNMRRVDINAIVEEVLGLMSQKTRYANVVVESSLTPDLASVCASPSELQQVLLNLVNNAVDAIGHGGGTISIATQGGDDEVILTVRDTGEGIAEANLPRIFDPFFTTKPVGQGTGLGLSICYGIVDKLGGRIEVASEKGDGTTFTIILPLSSEKCPDCRVTEDDLSESVTGDES